MKVVHQPSEVDSAQRPVCAAIGFFDGVHLGHQQVVRHMLACAQARQGLSMVITFDCHPSTVVAPERAPRLIYPLAKKLQILADLGIAITLLYHFDRAFSEQPAPVFVQSLVSALKQLASLSVGSNFAFGHRRQGNLKLLEQLGQQSGMQVEGIEPVVMSGQPISSTRIRASIRGGQCETAGQMLGRPYAIAGKVVAGDRLGHQLGFPTANLDATGLVLPPNGVYAVTAIVGKESWPGVMNIGFRPTLQLPAPQLHVEAHLLDFNGDLYGADMDIVVRQRLRDEHRFTSRQELQTQIRKDIAAARTVLTR